MENKLKAPVQVMVAPVHLKSLTAIADVFKRRKEVIKRWHSQGAPIACEQGQYCAEYNQLMVWLVRQDGSE